MLAPSSFFSGPALHHQPFLKRARERARAASLFLVRLQWFKMVAEIGRMNATCILAASHVIFISVADYLIREREREREEFAMERFAMERRLGGCLLGYASDRWLAVSAFLAS